MFELHRINAELLILKKQVSDFFGDSAGILDALSRKLSAKSEKNQVLEGTFIVGDIDEKLDPTDGVRVPIKHGVLKVGERSAIRIFGSPKSSEDAVSHKTVTEMLEPLHESVAQALRYRSGAVFAHFFEFFDGKTKFNISTSSRVCSHPEWAEHFRIVENSVSILKPGSYEVEVHISSSTMTPSPSALTVLRLVQGSTTTLIDRLHSPTADVRLKGVATISDGKQGFVEWLIGGTAAGVSVSLTVTRIGD